MFSGEDLAKFGLELITALVVGLPPEPYWSFRSIVMISTCLDVSDTKRLTPKVRSVLYVLRARNEHIAHGLRQECVPVDALEEGVLFDLFDTIGTESLARIELQQAVDEISRDWR